MKDSLTEDSVNSMGVILDDKTTEDENRFEPKVGMTFENMDELFAFYKRYSKHVGFPVKRRSSKKDDSGIVKWVSFACSREGSTRSKYTCRNPVKPRPTMKTGCKAKLMACLDVIGGWRISSVNLVHNHDLSPSKVRYFSCNRQINERVRKRLLINDKAGVRMNKNWRAQVVEAGGYENVDFTERDVRNCIAKERRLRLGDGDAVAIQNYFLKMQAESKGFFSSIDLDPKGRLRNVFWADGRSREAYKEFGDVVTFDTTYLINKYDMPFAPFVGVNHHGQSTLLGCALISKEDIGTFTWLFETWVACMDGCAPNAIITDQDAAMKRAIEIVFPNARHRWCLWHILKKLPEKLPKGAKFELISSTLRGVVYDSESPAEFERDWNEMVGTYDLHKNKWLNTMYMERRRWVPCFVKDTFWAGMSTTQRSESMNAFFDGYVNSKTSLKQFVEQYGNALRCKVEKESLEDFRSFSKTVRCVTRYQIEKQVRDAFTISKFQEFQQELLRKMYCELASIRDIYMGVEYDVEEDVAFGDDGCRKRKTFIVTVYAEQCEVMCSCRLFEFKGILCRHALYVLIRLNVSSLPEKYIFRRWRKDVRRCHTRVKINYDGCITLPEQLRYDKMCYAFSKVADLAADDEEKFNGVMELIDSTMGKLSISNSNHGRTQQTPNCASKTKSTVTKQKQKNESQNILDPIVVRGKGRPPEKRKEKTTWRKNKGCNTKEASHNNKENPNKRKKQDDPPEIPLSSQVFSQVPGITQTTQEIITLGVPPTYESTHQTPRPGIYNNGNMDLMHEFTPLRHPFFPESSASGPFIQSSNYEGYGMMVGSSSGMNALMRPDFDVQGDTAPYFNIQYSPLDAQRDNGVATNMMNTRSDEYNFFR